MRLSEMLKPQNIKLALEGKTKNDAIKELVDLLAANGEVQDGKKVLDAVLERETTRTTGIGNGLAIPHGKCTGTAIGAITSISRPELGLSCFVTSPTRISTFSSEAEI